MAVATCREKPTPDSAIAATVEPSSRRSRICAAIEEIEDDIEEEHLETVSEAEHPEVHRVPRRVLHRRLLLNAVRLCREDVKATLREQHKMEKHLRGVTGVV